MIYSDSFHCISDGVETRDTIDKHSWQIARKSRNSFVDVQSKKTVKKTDEKFRLH